jgi:hypothetical protein
MRYELLGSTMSLGVCFWSVEALTWRVRERKKKRTKKIWGKEWHWSSVYCSNLTFFPEYLLSHEICGALIETRVAARCVILCL